MKSSYYVTCLMSGMVELGTIFWGLRYQYSVAFILGLALAYQMGNILRFFVTRSLSKAQDLIACFTVAISVFLLFADKDAPLTYVLTVMLFILFSIVLQNVRSSAQGSIPRWQKRSCRVLGFVLSAFMFWAGPVLMVLITCLLLFYSVNLNKYYYDRLHF